MSAFVHRFFDDHAKAPFAMRVAPTGTPSISGQINQGESPLVEFYDGRWSFHRAPDSGEVLGQFVSSYRLETLLEKDSGGRDIFDRGRLDLEIGISDWKLGPGAMANCRHALQAAGALPEAGTYGALKSGFMAFAAQTPIIGLDPHPAYAPDDARAAHASTASDWAEVYSIYPTRAAAEAEALEDYAAREDAVAAGDLEDCDEANIILPVCVDADGTVVVFDFSKAKSTVAVLTSEEIFEKGFGMTSPDSGGPRDAPGMP